MDWKSFLYIAGAFYFLSCQPQQETSGVYVLGKIGAKRGEKIEFQIEKVIRGEKLENILLKSNLRAKSGDTLRVYKYKLNSIVGPDRIGFNYEIK